ncbi:hypothetical protein NP233_g9487 [Leucocoprinus birnbaumii]|uniref:HMG box domain-containing protein n=1 Tax=Leucocoprinus birnbaumii TaxID=56174 RepID=A0AAD5VKC8_9AGAR|nr:hypothetical protein NP233_g9487 [Leucocoprinus birnbaumii]
MLLQLRLGVSRRDLAARAFLLTNPFSASPKATTRSISANGTGANKSTTSELQDEEYKPRRNVTNAWIEFQSDFKGEPKSASAHWRAMTAEEKEPYARRAEEKRKRLHEDRRKWLENYGSNLTWEIPPYASLSGWSMFVKESLSRPSPALAAKWKALSENDRQAYETRAATEKELRSKAYLEWIDATNRNNNGRALELLNAQRKEALNKKNNIKFRTKKLDPEFKKPWSAYIRFYRDYLAEHPEARPPPRDCALSWHSLPEDRKQAYRDAAAAEMKVWSVKYAAFKSQQLPQ